MAIFGPLIEEADAAIIMQDAPYGFGCVGCARTNELTLFTMRHKNMPILELQFPKSRDETVDAVYKISTFLSDLKEEEEKTKQEE